VSMAENLQAVVARVHAAQLAQRRRLDGRLDPASPVELTAEQRWQELVPKRFALAKLDRLDDDVLSLVAGWDTRQNVAILGPVGTGKTFTALAMARERYLTASMSMLFYPVVDVLAMLRPDGDERVTIDRLSTVPLLVLDDFGSERASPWTVEQLFAVINRRWMEERPTIVTTNHEPATLKETVEPRTYSRLVGEAYAIRLNGLDRRQGEEA